MNYAFYPPNDPDHVPADCACCGCQFDRDAHDPEELSCPMCRDGESPGMDALPSETELHRVNYELDCGIHHVLPYG